MFDSKVELAAYGKEHAIARVLIEAKGKLLKLPTGTKNDPDYLVWTGLIVEVCGSQTFEGSYVKLLTGRQINTSLSLDEIKKLLTDC